MMKEICHPTHYRDAETYIYETSLTNKWDQLTLWRPLLPYGYSYKAPVPADQIKLSPECQSVRMSKITNDRLNPVWHRMLYSFYSCTHMVMDWIVQCFTSPLTQYRLHGRRFLQVKRPNQQYQSTEGSCKGKQPKEQRKHKIHMHGHTQKVDKYSIHV